jgi:hypothetical protein
MLPSFLIHAYNSINTYNRERNCALMSKSAQHELRLDGAAGVRPVASVFDGLTRRADLESEYERRNAPVTTPNTRRGGIGHALSVSRDRVPVISHGDNFPRASVWRGTMKLIEFADTLAVICG